MARSKPGGRRDSSCRVATVAFIAALGIGAVAPAEADAILVFDVKVGSLQASDKFYLGNERLKLEPSPDAFTLFRADQNVIYDVSVNKKSYVRITTDLLRQAAALFDASRPKYAEKLASMPEDKRQHLQQAFGPPTALSAPHVTFTPAELPETYGTWHCKVVQFFIEGVQQGSVCVVPLGDTGLDAGDVQVLKKLTEFALNGPRAIAGFASLWDLGSIEQAVKYPAFPVHTIYAVPSGWDEYTLRSVTKQPIPPATFELSADLTETALPAHPRR
jgi:hypothetical protein